MSRNRSMTTGAIEETVIYTVIYRVGGPARFEWRYTLIRSADRDAVEAHRQEIERMGYAAAVVPVGTPLPEDFDL